MPVIKGKATRARFTSLKLNELSTVDRPAQPGALATIMKRHTAADPSLMAVAVAKYVCEEDGAHTFQEVLQANAFDEKIWPMVSALTQAIRSIMGDKETPQGDKEAKVTQSVDEFLSAVREIAPTAEKQLAELISKRTDTMPKTIEQLQAEVSDLTSKNATLTSERDAATVRADKAEADLATEKSAHSETQKKLTEATDEVITVGGTELRKSVAGEANFSVAKALADERDMARFEKRVETEFSHLPGTVAEKALVLKSIAGLPEDARKAHEAILTSAENMASAGFTRLGQGGGTSPTAKAAEDGFMAKVAEIKKRDNCADHEAMSKARREFPAEFEAYSSAAN